MDTSMKFMNTSCQCTMNTSCRSTISNTSRRCNDLIEGSWIIIVNSRKIYERLLQKLTGFIYLPSGKSVVDMHIRDNISYPICLYIEEGKMYDIGKNIDDVIRGAGGICKIVTSDYILDSFELDDDVIVKGYDVDNIFGHSMSGSIVAIEGGDIDEHFIVSLDTIIPIEITVDVGNLEHIS